MAHAALVSLARTLKQVQDEDQSDSLFGGKDNMESLHENIMRLLNFLEDFPEQHAPSVRPLEDRIRDAAYELEDVIERYVTLSGIRPKLIDLEDRNDLTQLLDTYIQDVKPSIKHLDSILELATKENIYTVDSSKRAYNTFSSASGTSRHAPSGKETIVKDDFIKIKHLVTSGERNLHIIPIVGTGGIGKTTLARYVYEDQLIKEQFDYRFWVTVSQGYRVQEVLQGLLPKEGPMEECVERLIELVYKSLYNRRYLIVLDDMWHGEVWDRVRRAFPDDKTYSRAIITTRLPDVAAAVDSSSLLHRMQFMNEEQSWDLLREKVYGQDCCPRELQEVGKIIARNCKGLPLTTVVISGLLKINKTKDHWDSVAKNIKGAIATNDNEFFAILSLSYDNLPHHLKACFLYMGIFPEDYRIPINKLIKLWVAEGFLKPARSRSLEEVAEENLEDLVNRSLVLVTEKRSNGRIRFCSIHDSLRELSIIKGHEVKFLQHYRCGYIDEYNIIETPIMQRRLIIHTIDMGSLPDDIHDSPVRSLLYFSLYSTGVLAFTSGFFLLRVVDGLEIKFERFPDEILNLVNLTYLAFTYNYSSTCYFPSTIIKLKNLQTLIVHTKDLYSVLIFNLFMPSEIWKMPQLRHLVLNKPAILRIPEREELGESSYILHNLQTLHVKNFKITKEVVERLPNLMKLKVKYIWPGPKHWPAYCISNLVYLQQLQELNFELEAIPFEPNISRFPQSLKKLTLKGSRIPWEKMSIVSSLPNLEVLKLKKESAIGTEWEISDDFSSLKHLEMEYIDLEEWILESNHFPCLKRLIIQCCRKLKEVPESIGEIPTLQILTIKRCNFGVEESVRKIQKSLDDDYLKVHIVL